jgi:succinoglycan biosynthesis protein ExoO
VPIVSVLVANRNRKEFLAAAIESALRQTLSNIEIIIIDDASIDESPRIALEYAARDERVRVILRKKNGGPAAARNAGLEIARGIWVAILDSDDFMHPERLERLVAEAEASGAEVCADDLLVFGSDTRPSGLLSMRQRQLACVTLSEFIASNEIFSKEPAIGYLKPVIKRSFLEAHKINYDTSLVIGEDYDLLARVLACGAKFRLVDCLGYFYRKHASSTSHRLSPNDLLAMIRADDRLRATLKEIPPQLSRAFDGRTASIKRALEFDNLITALKTRAWGKAARVMLRSPNVVPLLAMPAAARLSRLSRIRQPKTLGRGKQACLISRQRLIGTTNGSSAYLLGICNVLRENGYRITLVSPNAGTFGRLPFFFLGPEMAVFSDIFLRGAWRIGARLCIVKDPRVAFAAAKSIIARLAGRVGVNIADWDKPAPYVIGAPWQRDEFIYLSSHAPPADLIVADYAFTTPAIPFALSGDAKSLVVMHDLLSERVARFRNMELTDSVATLGEAEEIRLLGQAEAVIAIQDVEAKKVRALLPQRPVLLTPVACEFTATSQPGNDKSILFVGSNTAPNVIGLRWFLETIWPRILTNVPNCQLFVAGGVASQFSRGAIQTRFLGVVADLSPLYEQAGVVISPLTVGSGLKVKIVEALAHGKAIVATRTSIEGIDEEVISAISVRDDPSSFSEAVCELLLSEDLRRSKALQAFEGYRRRCSQERCYRELLSYLGAPNDSNTPARGLAEGNTALGLLRAI